MSNKRPVYPPAYFLGGMLSMIALHVLVPFARWGSEVWQYAGGGAIVLSLGFMVVSARIFDQVGTTIKPFEESSTLVIRGPFRLSRNPMYLGMVGMLTGLALVLGTASPVVVIPVFVWLLTTRFIVAEERALQARFGDDFRAYQSRVRRWL
jgi:protein-S-isoprenylcysteine O-methyltransferase Ste14